MRQVCEAVAELHRIGIIHQDLKEGNILIAFDKYNQLDELCAKLPLAFKLADFGIAKNLNTTSIEQISFNSGTARYMSPEMLQAKRGEIKFPQKLDIFAMGVIVFHLVCKAYPFSSN
jgi:serine/threonine-protein kinase